MTRIYCGTRAALAGLAVVALVGAGAAAPDPDAVAEQGAYTGSASCIRCHERFHGLWESSRHGTAMQPFTPELAHADLRPQTRPIEIGGTPYRVAFDDDGGWVETGPAGEAEAAAVRYPITWVMGGKNVYYFLTPMERGRLQVLPIAYDMRRGEWYDTAGSGVRHFTDREDEALDWRDPAFTFNTSCHACHVSQLSRNYDAATDSYRSTWNEAGINCETCHGPCEEHIRVCDEAGEGNVPDDLATVVISAGRATAEQVNSSCGSCHAKMAPFSDSFAPGDRFFDRFDLVGIESPDFYPDGRDLGENYSYTTWLLSPCVHASDLDCMHCHTSSGRYRFHGAEVNDACLPCHRDHVEDPVPHTRHDPDGPGSHCVSCHMPMTEFARMRRSDHSMRPPMPAATIEFGSPNACNICHGDRDAEWADRLVREWRDRDYQAATLHWAGLAHDARRGDWDRLDEMVAWLAEAGAADEIPAAALVRLLAGCPDRERAGAAVIEAADHPAPLVRGSVGVSLSPAQTQPAVDTLVELVADDYRVVRLRAAAALARIPAEALPEDARGAVAEALADLEATMVSRADDYVCCQMLGNLRLDRGDAPAAVAAFAAATRLRGDLFGPWVNLAIAQHIAGDVDAAEKSLGRALELDPEVAGVHLNLGLLLGEAGRPDEARERLRTAFELDPTLAVAAYNLAVLAMEDDPAEAAEWAGRAAEQGPDRPRYAYTLAFCLRRAGDPDAAAAVLEGLVGRFPGYADAWMMWADIAAESVGRERAAEICQAALDANELAAPDRGRILAAIRGYSRAPRDDQAEKDEHEEGDEAEHEDGE